MRECHILRPELFALFAPLRRLLGGLMPPKRAAEVQLTLATRASTCCCGVAADGLAAIEALTAFAWRTAWRG